MGQYENESKNAEEQIRINDSPTQGLDINSNSFEIVSLERLSKVIRGIKKGWTSCTRIPQLAISGLQWWLSRIISNKAYSIIPPPPTQAIITTDASHLGWGATLNRSNQIQIAWGKWPLPKFLKSSYQRDLRAVYYALMHFANICRTEEIHSILIRSDNQVAVQNINRRKAAPILEPTLRQIYRYADQMNLEIEAVYLKGEQNSTADRLSRLEKAGHYQVKEEIIKMAFLKLKLNPTLDAFANRRNAFLPRFISPTDDNLAVGINGLKHPWGKEVIYAHPPIEIIGKFLQKIQEENITVILVLPDLEQWWTPVVRQMAQMSVLASLARIAPYIDESGVSISSFFGNTAALTVRRALKYCADKQMAKTKLCATKQGLYVIMELLGGPPVSKSQLLTSFTKKLASNKVIKAKYKTVWKVEQLLDFEINSQDQTAKKDIQAHAAVFLQLCTTLRGAEIAALNRSSILINTKEMLVIALKRKKRNQKRTNEQQLRDIIRRRLRQAGVPRQYGSNTIRHAVITKLRSSGLTLEQVNLLTDHAYGSRVVDDYYCRPDKPLSIGNILEQLYSDSRVVSVLQTSPNKEDKLRNGVDL
ncbi:MAG: putative Pol polyprotein [Streblomastix strix]|uniref:Putative Pol polyprotein n=1 Tax=Streblomastix strix TaxID=222440 RepID=A0A5J4WAG3_9EUKA|nr:MAG: putative Pol polyprotein [Streblomastix strix]